MYEQSPLQQPSLSSLEQFGRSQAAGAQEYAQQGAGQSQQPQQFAGVQQPQTQQYAQQSPIQQPTAQQYAQQPTAQQSPIQQAQPPQAVQTQPQQTPVQQPQQTQPQQFGAPSQILGQQPTAQQFQQPRLPSQFGSIGAQSTWAQSQQPQFQQPQPTPQVGQSSQQTGQAQQIPVGSVPSESPQQIPVEHGQHAAQQTPWQSFGQHELTRQSVEMADTPTLADALARRLGLTSQQLAQVLPQLGAALGAPTHGQQLGVASQAAMPQQGPTPIQPGIQQ
ncbi:hypothetical protein [Halobacterium litoreum]|uniref:Uncharacterized protein n=1 Tax=Halobacterium litoreum TaxID=2039234 RepID=A0ABD5NDZ2_9EURY|nr:hypothetical protein [Halobacterium litoreum]UHH13867.1 hypothetical protein LT972_02450 [Halobacterium litoreum]